MLDGARSSVVESNAVGREFLTFNQTNGRFTSSVSNRWPASSPPSFRSFFLPPSQQPGHARQTIVKSELDGSQSGAECVQRCIFVLFRFDRSVRQQGKHVSKLFTERRSRPVRERWRGSVNETNSSKRWPLKLFTSSRKGENTCPGRRVTRHSNSSNEIKLGMGRVRWNTTETFSS